MGFSAGARCASVGENGKIRGMDASMNTTLDDGRSREPVVAVVFAGGSGTRMGAAVPKQFLELNGKPVLAHVLELFERHPEVDRIRLVVQREYIAAAESLCRKYGIGKLAGVCEGGASAQESIYRGLPDHLGNSRFKPDLQCLDRPREPASPNPEAEKAVRTTEGF